MIVVLIGDGAAQARPMGPSIIMDEFKKAFTQTGISSLDQKLLVVWANQEWRPPNKRQLQGENDGYATRVSRCPRCGRGGTGRGIHGKELWPDSWIERSTQLCHHRS